MAIAKIKKIELIGLHKDKDGLLALLQKLGKLQLLNIQQLNTELHSQIIEQSGSFSDFPTAHPEVPERSEGNEGSHNLLEAEDAISFLASFKRKSGRFLESMANLKPFVYQQELKEVINSFDYQIFLNELSALHSQLNELMQHKERLDQKRQVLAPWRKLNIPLEEAYPTKHCSIFLGILATADYENLLEDLTEENINLFSEIISQDKANTYLIILYLHKDFERLEALLKNYHFNFVTLGHNKGNVKDNLLEINIEILMSDDQILDIKNKIIELSKEQFKLMVVYDYLANIKKRSEADKNLAQQQFTFTLSGWIKAKDTALLEKEVTNNFRDVALFISDPPPGKDVPVVLENKRLIQPFEFITQIYGMPQYNEIDPTPFLAPFFFLYFGFCISDVGYGMMLIIVSWLILKKFKMGPQGQKFWKLFLFCGISTVFIGAATGSWFGNLFDLVGESNKIFLPLKKFKDSLVILDPLKEPTKLLGIALMFGIIQVWFGNIVAAIGNIKNKRFLNVVLDQVPMLIFLFGFTGIGLGFLKILDNSQMSLFKYSIIAGAVTLILTQGRLEKGIGAKLFYGIYNLYNAFSGYLSDILSYSRLWALGLVTGVMATTINLIAVQFSQIMISMLPFMDKIIFLKILVSSLVLIVIFVLGHLASFLMSLLGAFVHPVRLQFVEFFSKFFKSGGNTLRPFKIETKYVNLSEAQTYVLSVVEGPKFDG